MTEGSRCFGISALLRSIWCFGISAPLKSRDTCAVGYILLGALCAAVFFWRLGAIPLIGLDEGSYAECSREMLASGDYVVPTCNGELLFDKPALAYWLQAASMRAFGVNSFAARLPSAVESLALVGLTVLLGARLFSRLAGLMAGFALGCSMVAAGLARLAILDAAFALAISASLGAFLLAYVDLAPRWTYLVFWAAMGVSVMVKGPAGAALILATVFVFLLIRRDWKAMRRAMPVPGALVCAAIALPWYALVEHRTGAFLSEFLVHQNIQRALGQDFAHNGPFYYYLPAFVVGFFPWSVFLPAAFSSRKHGREETRKGEDIARLFLTVWIGAILVVFSIFRSKLPGYIFPMYPPSALLVGLVWSRAIERGELAALRRCGIAAAALACLIAAAMLVAPRYLPEPIPGLVRALVPMGASLAVGCAAGYALLALARPLPAFAALCAGMGAFVVTAVWLGLPIAARTNAVPAMRMGQQIGRRAEPAFAFSLSPPQPQLGFYAGRAVRRVVSASGIRVAESCLVVAQSDRLRGLPSGGRVEARIGPYVLLRFAHATSSSDAHRGRE